MRILIVKLSSLGDVVHAMPAVADIRRVHPGARIDWVVEPGFAPLLRRVRGLDSVIECALRRWRRSWWQAGTRAEWRQFRARLQRERYDVVLDLQGLTKSALIARLAQGTRYGLANRTDGSSHEWPARWLVDHAIRVPWHIHAVDRSRLLAARALDLGPTPPPDYGLHASAAAPLPDRTGPPTVVLVHGTSREDKLWPVDDWVALGRRLRASGWRVALPRSGAVESLRAIAIEQAIGGHGGVWPEMPLDALVDRMAATQGVIGVDSGLSHIAVALGLPHVQIYNLPTAWRTGPQPEHGHAHQVSVEGAPPPLSAVLAAWRAVQAAADAAAP